MEVINEKIIINDFLPYNVRIFNSLFDFRAYVELPCWQVRGPLIF